MKKVFFTILCIGILQVCFSQQKDSDYSTRKGFSIEPYLGLGTSEAVQNGTSILGWKAGCGLVYMFNDHWGISSGLQVQQYSTKIISGTDSIYVHQIPIYPSFWDAVTIDVTYNFSYLELPFIVKYVSSSDHKFGILVEAGIIFGDLLTSNESGTIYTTTIDTTTGSYFPNGTKKQMPTFSLPRETPLTSTFNFEGHLAIGGVIPISKICSIITDISINKGFTNVGNSSKDYTNTVIGLFYYYNKNNNNFSSSTSNYGTNFSMLFSVLLNIKL